MDFFDAHCDTLYEMTFFKKELWQNDLKLDLKRIKNYDSYTQVFAIWLENEEKAEEKFLKMVCKFDEEIEKNSQKIMKCTSFSEFKSAKSEKKCAAFLSLEGANCVKKAEDIGFVFKKGVRIIQLTWNGENLLAGGVNSDTGLSKLGKQCIFQMERLGIVADVSHLNEKSFWEVIKNYKRPIIASHSNSKSLCPHVRNLTDEQFLAICRSDGCVGINFFPDFLTTKNTCNAEDIIHHIRHFLKLGGENHIGLGSDFDGTKTLPAGILGAEDMGKIITLLERAKIRDNVIDKITHENFERIISGL